MPPGQLPSVREACNREERNNYCTVSQQRPERFDFINSGSLSKVDWLLRLHNQPRVSQQCRLSSETAEEREACLEQRSPRAVVYSPTVVGEEALGEDDNNTAVTPTHSVLQPRCTVQSAIPSHVLHPHTFSMSKRRRRRWKGVPVISHSTVVLCI